MVLNCIIASAMLVKVHSGIVNRTLNMWDENETACMKALPQHITSSFVLWVVILAANCTLVEILNAGIIEEANRDIQSRLEALIIARISAFYSVVIFDLLTGKLSRCFEVLTCRTRSKT